MSNLGRIPQPAAFKVMAGNPGHRPIEKSDRQAETSIPEKPKMSPAAGEIWDSLVDEMRHVKGLLQTRDQRGLWQLSEDEAMLSMVYAGVWQATQALGRKAEAEALAKGREVADLMPGGPMLAWLTTSAGRLAMSTINNMAARVVVERREFGLTPSSRLRVAAGKVGGSEMDDLESKLCG